MGITRRRPDALGDSRVTPAGRARGPLAAGDGTIVVHDCSGEDIGRLVAEHRLISSELLKLRSTRTAIAPIASVVGLVVLIGLIATITADFEQDEVLTVDLLGIAGFAQVFALILGILAVTTEFRHGTITRTLIVAPDRVRVVLAKLVAHVLAGLILGVLVVGLTTAIVLITLSSRDIDSA